jgi:hypothetical protein
LFFFRKKIVTNDLRIVDPLSFEGWDASILEFKEVSFFHSSHWARLLSNAYGFKPLYCTAFVNNKLAAVIPLMEVRDIIGRKKGVSLPFSDFCQPLYNDKAVFDEVFEFAVETARANKWRSVVIRGNAPFASDVPISESYFRHVLPLKKDEQVIFKTFRNSTQRNIKKASAAGIRVIFESTYNAVKKFCHLNCLARRDHGLPPQPDYFFDHFFHAIIEKGHGEVALARCGDTAVSASVFLKFGQLILYKYGASDKRFNNTCANYLVMWEAIRRYRADGYKTFCFGKTEVQHKGLLQFKTGWGAEQQVINNYRYNVRKRTFVRSSLKTAGIFNIVIRRLPMPVLKIISLLAYKYMA